MKIYSKNIQAGFFALQVGKLGGTNLNGKMPTRSFHLGWQDLPPNTKSLALTFVDHDAIPVCGFSWIHWLVANIDPTLGELLENASEDEELLEGVNSWASPLLPQIERFTLEEATAYGGCAPPDKTHVYTIEVYALNTLVDLPIGFYMNDLYHAMRGHILGKVKLEGAYKSTR